MPVKVTILSPELSVTFACKNLLAVLTRHRSSSPPNVLTTRNGFTPQAKQISDL
jgi:hypothetical protein